MVKSYGHGFAGNSYELFLHLGCTSAIWHAPKVSMKLKKRSTKIKMMCNRIYEQVNSPIAQVVRAKFRKKKAENNVRRLFPVLNRIQ